MKLLFITNKYPPLSCGVGDYTYHLAKEFSNQNNEVSVICRSDVVISEHWKNREEKVKLYAIGGAWEKQDWKTILKHIDDVMPDKIVFQYVAGSYSPYAMPWKLMFFFRQLKKRPVTILTTFHETYVRYNWSHPKYAYLAIAQRLIVRTVAKNSDYIVTSINRFQQRLKRWHNHISLIPVGSNILPIPVETEALLALRKTIMPDGASLICTFGDRNHKALLDIFTLVLEAKPDCVLLIIGKLNVNLIDYSDKVINRVHTTGFLEASDVFKYLKASDVFLNVTNFDHKGGANSKSGALAAAFAAGLPILGTIGRMTNQLLIEESKIQWFTFENKIETNDLIIKLLNQKEKRKELSKASLEFYNNYLSWQQIRKQYEHVLEKNENT